MDFVFPRLSDLSQRITAYPSWEVAVEFALIWIVIFAILRFVQGTRAAGALKGLLLLVVSATLVSRFIGGGESFQRVGFLYDRFLALVAVALVVIFQPELRRALIRLGETPFFRQSRSEISSIAEAIADACRFLSKAKFGALIVIERQDSLSGLVEEGTILDAQLSPRLLQTIFFPGTALHDLAVVIRGDRVQAASVQLPLAEPGDMPDPTLGSRHRAAVGLTRDSDALVVVVSEETGSLRISERGKLHGPFSVGELASQIKSRLGREPVQTSREEAEEEAEAPSLKPGSDSNRAAAARTGPATSP